MKQKAVKENKISIKAKIAFMAFLFLFVCIALSPSCSQDKVVTGQINKVVDEVKAEEPKTAIAVDKPPEAPQDSMSNMIQIMNTMPIIIVATFIIGVVLPIIIRLMGYV